MIRVFALVGALAVAGCQYTAAPLPAGVDPALLRFTAACSNFYEVVSDVIVQRRLGNISDETYDALNPYIKAGDVICQGVDPDETGDALERLEDVMTGIALERAAGEQT